MVLHSVPFWSMFSIGGCVFCCFSCGISVHCTAYLLLFAMCMLFYYNHWCHLSISKPWRFGALLAKLQRSPLYLSCTILFPLPLLIPIPSLLMYSWILCDCILSKCCAPELNPISQFTSAVCAFKVWHDFCHCVSSCQLTRKKWIYTIAVLSINQHKFEMAATLKQ